MNEEKLFDIVLFYWDEWDEIDLYCLQFYNVQFPFESMKKYNGMDVSLDRNGELKIYDGDEEVWKGFVFQIPEFMHALEEKYK